MKQLLCFGDSNTWGYVPGTGERYPWGIRWTSILQDKLNVDGVRVLEEGLNGRTTAFDDTYRGYRSGVRTLPFILESQSPIDAAVIMLGTNDCKTSFNLSAAEIAKGMEQCIDKLLTILPANKILLISPIHLGDGVWEREYDPEFSRKSFYVSRELKEAYRKLAEEKRIHMIAASDHAEPSETDREHMTPEGHAALAMAVYRALKEIL